MTKLLLVALVLFGISRLDGTEQMPDFLTLDGERGEVRVTGSCLSPIERYFVCQRRAYPFEEAHTGNYRGHIAEWKIEEKKLHLVSLLVEGGNQGEIDTAFDLKRLFPPVHGKKEVFADWFTGMLLVQEGKHQVDLEDGSYTVKFKRYRILSIKGGVLTRSVALDPASYWAAVKEIHSEVPPESLSANGALLRAFHDDQLDAGIRARPVGDGQPAPGPESKAEGGGQPQPELDSRSR